MIEDRGKKDFEADLVKSLEQMDYTIYAEKEKMSKFDKYGSPPDIIAIKDKTALIIETKSERESEMDNCLGEESGSEKHPYYRKFKEWREYCASLPDKNAAVWMVHINLQALYYPLVFKQPGGWQMREKLDNEKLEECTRIPTLAFPESYKKKVQEAVRLMGIEINESAFMELGSGQLLLQFERDQRMIEVVPYSVDKN